MVLNDSISLNCQGVATVFMKHERTGIESGNHMAPVTNLPYIIICYKFKIIYKRHVCRSLNFTTDARAMLIR